MPPPIPSGTGARRRSNSNRHRRPTAHAPAPLPPVSLVDVLDVSPTSLALHVLLRVDSDAVCDVGEGAGHVRRKRGPSRSVHGGGPAVVAESRMSKPAFRVLLDGNPWPHVAHIDLTPAEASGGQCGFQAIMAIFGLNPGIQYSFEIEMFPESKSVFPLAIAWQGGSQAVGESPTGHESVVSHHPVVSVTTPTEEEEEQAGEQTGKRGERNNLRSEANKTNSLDSRNSPQPSQLSSAHDDATLPSTPDPSGGNAIHSLRSELKTLKAHTRRVESDLMTAVALARMDVDTGRKEDVRAQARLATLSERLSECESGQKVRLGRLHDLLEEKQALTAERRELDAVLDDLRQQLDALNLEELHSYIDQRSRDDATTGVEETTARMNAELEELHAQVEETEKVKRKNAKDRLRALEKDLGRIEGELIQLDKAERNLALAVQLSSEKVPLSKKRSIASSLKSISSSTHNTNNANTAVPEIPPITPESAAAAADIVVAAAAASKAQNASATVSPGGSNASQKQAKPFVSYFRWGGRRSAFDRKASNLRFSQDVVYDLPQQQQQQQQSNINLGKLFRWSNNKAVSPNDHVAFEDDGLHPSNASVHSADSEMYAAGGGGVPNFYTPSSTSGYGYTQSNHSGYAPFAHSGYAPSVQSGYPVSSSAFHGSPNPSVYSSGNATKGGFQTFPQGGYPNYYPPYNNAYQAYNYSNASLHSVNSTYSHSGYGNRRRAMSNASVASYVSRIDSRRPPIAMEDVSSTNPGKDSLKEGVRTEETERETSESDKLRHNKAKDESDPVDVSTPDNTSQDDILDEGKERDKDAPSKNKLISSKRLLSPLSTMVKEKKTVPVAGLDGKEPQADILSSSAETEATTPSKSKRPSSSGSNFLTQSLLLPKRSLSSAFMKRSESGEGSQVEATATPEKTSNENEKPKKKNIKKGQALGHIAESEERISLSTGQKEDETKPDEAGEEGDPGSTSWATKIGSWSQAVRRPGTAGG